MIPNDLPVPAPAAVSTGAYRDETKKLSFWISQLFILLATVFGVYLASSQGFRQALAFGEIQGDKSSYFLRKSLQGEIADNLVLVRDYMQRLETGGLAARKAPFRLDSFVWETLKSAPATLETPPDLLRESRLFYRGVADIQEKVANNTYEAKTGIARLGELVNRMEKDVLPRFSANLRELRQSLARRGVTVE